MKNPFDTPKKQFLAAWLFFLTLFFAFGEARADEVTLTGTGSSTASGYDGSNSQSNKTMPYTWDNNSVYYDAYHYTGEFTTSGGYALIEGNGVDSSRTVRDYCSINLNPISITPSDWQTNDYIYSYTIVSSYDLDSVSYPQTSGRTGSLDIFNDLGSVISDFETSSGISNLDPVTIENINYFLDYTLMIDNPYLKDYLLSWCDVVAAGDPVNFALGVADLGIETMGDLYESLKNYAPVLSGNTSDPDLESGSCRTGFLTYPAGTSGYWTLYCSAAYTSNWQQWVRPDGYIGINYTFARLGDDTNVFVNMYNNSGVGSGSVTSLDWSDSDNRNNLFLKISGALPEESQEGLLMRLFYPDFDDIEVLEDFEDDLGILYMPFDAAFLCADRIRNMTPTDKMYFKVPAYSYKGHSILESATYEYDVGSLFPSNWWDLIRYFACFCILSACAAATFNHIFNNDKDLS